MLEKQKNLETGWPNSAIKTWLISVLQTRDTTCNQHKNVKIQVNGLLFLGKIVKQEIDLAFLLNQNQTSSMKKCLSRYCTWGNKW